MSFSFWLSMPALALMPLSAIAQHVDVPPNATTYQSPFKNYRPASDAQTSPDQNWLQANRQVQSGASPQNGMSMNMALRHATDAHAAHHHHGE